MNCFGVAVLRILNQEYHQEGDNGRGGVDDQLPGVGKMKSGASEEPDSNHKHSSSKCPGAAENHGRMARENTEHVADDAKEIAFLLAFSQFLDLGFIQRATLVFAPDSQIARKEYRSPSASGGSSGIDFPAGLGNT
jgi:hypothetical protein